MIRFTTRLRVRRYEMDALGHVNNAVYLNYLEHVAVEHSEALGLTYEKYRDLGGTWVLRRMELEYLRPAFGGDQLDVTTWLQDMRGVRAIRRYEIRRAGEDDLILTAEALWVWVSLATMRPRPVPAEVIAIFEAQKD
jgi:acyl-CoA thioester hydrolase